MPKSSAALIEEMFQRFVAQHARLFPNEPALTKRQASRWLSETDLHVLARWTNEASHGKRRDWRIPIARIDVLCKALEATPDERDELMVARLNELMAHDKSEDVPALLHWLQPMLEEFANRPAVGPLERQVLAAFCRAYEETEIAHHCPAPFELEELLVEKLREWMIAAVGAHADQMHTESKLDGEETPEEKEALQVKMARLRARPPAAATGNRAKASPPGTPQAYARQRRALMREFSRNLRRTWRGLPGPTEASSNEATRA